MSKCRRIMVTSCKGGVGKTTVTANLAYTLALMNKRVLMLDLDLGMRCLDVVLNAEDKFLYDFFDVMTNGISPEKAVIVDPRSEHLYFLAAPYRCEAEITSDDLKKLLIELEETFALDYIIIDTHAGMELGTRLAAEHSDMALVVVTHQNAAIRAAEQTALMLSEFDIDNIKLIINSFDPRAVRRRMLPGVTETIDRTAIELIGAIPFSREFLLTQDEGILACEGPDKNIREAFSNIASRLEGKSVPLFTNFRHIARRVVRI